MRTNFNKDNIKKGLPGIITLSHGSVAQGILDTVSFLNGKLDNACYFCLEAGDDLDEYRAAIKEALDTYPEGTVVFVDLLGGSPANELLKIAGYNKDMEINAIGGMNVPAVLNASIVRSFMKGREIIESTITETRESIIDFKDSIAMLREDD